MGRWLLPTSGNTFAATLLASMISGMLFLFICGACLRHMWSFYKVGRESIAHPLEQLSDLERAAEAVRAERRLLLRDERA